MHPCYVNLAYKMRPLTLNNYFLKRNISSATTTIPPARFNILFANQSRASHGRGDEGGRVASDRELHFCFHFRGGGCEADGGERAWWLAGDCTGEDGEADVVKR